MFYLFKLFFLFSLCNFIYPNIILNHTCSVNKNSPCDGKIFYNNFKKKLSTNKVVDKNNLFYPNLNYMIDYCNIHPKLIYKLCVKYKGNCSYYKARLFEFYGNDKNALDLYNRLANFFRFTLLNAKKGVNPKPFFKKYKLSEDEKLFINIIFYKAIGDWKNLIKFKNIIVKNKSNFKAQMLFYLIYAQIMYGEIKNVDKLLKYNFDNFYDNLFIKKAKAIYFYAINKQYDSLKLFNIFLKYFPNDFISLKYKSEILFRTGFFEDALTIINDLIIKEAKDTEKFYLLKEKSFMLLRYGKINKSLKTFNIIFNDYSNTDLFIYEYIVSLINYSYIRNANNIIKKLKKINLYYYYLALSVFEDYKFNLNKSLYYLLRAKELNSSKELNSRIEILKKIIKKTNLIKINDGNKNLFDKNKYCKNVKVSKIDENYWKILNNNSIYYIEKKSNTYIAKLLIDFDFKKGINKKLINFNKFIDSLEKFWSVGNFKLDIIKYGADKVVFDYYPSSLYIKRANSISWPILLNKRVYYHEIGHLLGLDDEYYETDLRLSDFNLGRTIGDPKSIMRNILSGNPGRKHIKLIVKPLLDCWGNNESKKQVN